MGFDRKQPLNDWSAMLHEVFWRSQNYSRSSYEIHSHLSEICGLIGRSLLRRKDATATLDFLAKAFGWAIALVHRVEGEGAPVQEFLLRKFPECCTYCLQAPCICHEMERQPAIQQEELDRRFHRLPKRSRRMNEFQDMFRSIYEGSWETLANKQGVYGMRAFLFARLVEELAELHEALRFHHLYETNFRNEIADFFAWWFALVSTMHVEERQSKMLLAEDVVWSEYPGFCRHCNSVPCRCRPRPVRELMSKPSPSQLAFVDELTGLLNHRAFQTDLTSIASGDMPLPMPSACVFIDVDGLKSINERFGHSAGSLAIQHVGTVLRKKLRDEDRVYRWHEGDEFCAICPDLSIEEATGMFRRVMIELEGSHVLWSTPDHEPTEIPVTASAGIAECSAPQDVAAAFEQAESAYSQSNRQGNSQITIATSSHGA